MNCRLFKKKQELLAALVRAPRQQKLLHVAEQSAKHSPDELTRALNLLALTSPC